MLTPRHKVDYDAFEHLRHSLLGNEDDLFSMLTAYIDDSGSSAKDHVAVAAGYIATGHMWKTFEERWKTLLSKYGVHRMHRAELENFRGEFKNWTPDRRTEFVKKAQTIIRRCTYTGFGLALIKADYEEVIGKHKSLAPLGIFAWCAESCLAAVHLWQVEKGLNEPVNFVFEAGTSGSSQFNNILHVIYKDEESRRAHHLNSWSFGGKDLVPLQAADVVAYEYFKFVNNEVVERKKRPVRLSAQALFRQHEIPLFRHYNKQTFESFIARWDGTI